MLFPSDRKSGARRRLLCRVLVASGLAGLACTFPDYSFEPLVPDHCFNGSRDGNETNVDCGGDCQDCVRCEEPEDCDDNPCIDGYCRPQCNHGTCPASCDDGIHNGEETDTDCGGPCPNQCDVGQDCSRDEDCKEQVCDKTCLPPTCSDNVTNGDEPDVDCGAVCDEPCGEGQACDTGADCESEVCTDEQCAPHHCSNEVLDADRGETDVDCGGDATQCPRCAVGERCELDTDCEEQVCTDEVCQAASCDDGRRNGTESGEDCGGPDDCDRCEPGQHCQSDSDCIDGVCTDTTCQQPSCDDDVQNATETDIDCGGECPPCSDDMRCVDNADCNSQICEQSSDVESELRCSAPTCSDGVQNGEELGLDCGGGDCTMCTLGAHCTSDEACASYSCDDESCVEGMSVAYECGQCGDGIVSDMVSYRLFLTNLTDHDVDIGGLAMRYYLSLETTEELSFDCHYQEELSCGDDPRLVQADTDNSQATHYVETTLSSTLPALPANETAEVFIEVTWSNGSMDQSNDYSFNKDEQTSYARTPLYRDGILIWGSQPAPD